MVNTISLIAYLIFFYFIAWFRFRISLALLFLLLPTYLIRFNIGPLPTTLLEAMIWVIIIVWFIKTLKHESMKALIYRLSLIAYRHISLSIAITLFLLAATISIFTSLNTRAALGEWKAFYIEPFLVFLILIIEGARNNKSLEIRKIENSILPALILCGLATSILAIYQHFTGFLVPWAFWENGNSYRITAWYDFPNGIGLFLAPLIPLAVYLCIQHFPILRIRNWKLKTGNWVYWVTLISSFLFLISSPLAILYAKSTGGLIGVATGIGLLLIFWKKTRWPITILAISGLLTLVLLPITNPVKQELLMQDRSGQIRINMWSEAVEFLRANPLTGAGLASYQERIIPYHHPINGNDNIEIFHHQHNIFLTMWVNLGIFGLIGFVWMVVWFYRVGFQQHYKSYQLPATSYLMASMSAILVTGLVDTPYIKNDLALFFWLLLALMVISHRPNQNLIQSQS